MRSEDEEVSKEALISTSSGGQSNRHSPSSDSPIPLSLLAEGVEITVTEALRWVVERGAIRGEGMENLVHNFLRLVKRFN